MNKVLFDTSVLIPFLRKGQYLEEVIRLTRGELVFFSSVVAQELYAGSKNKRSSWQLDKLYFRFEKAGRLIVPQKMDWRAAGLALSRLAHRHGFDKIRQAGLVNDALIASTCRHQGVLLLTLNERDFELLQEVIDFEYRVPI